MTIARRALCALGSVALTLSSALAQTTPPRWIGTLELTVGGESAATATDFGRISGMALDAKGRIYIADTQDSQVRVFSPTGQLVNTIGRAGSGPTEFKRMATIAIGPDGNLWVRDEGNARLLVIDADKKPSTNVRTVPLRQFTSGGRAPITFEANGDVVDETIWFDPAQKTFRPLRTRISMTGDIVRTDTLRIPDGAFAGIHKISTPQKDKNGKVIGVSESSFFQPSGPSWQRAVGPGGVRAEVVTSRYAVSIYDSNGKLLRTLSRTVAPVPLSPSERAFADTLIKEAGADLPFGVPANKPPVAGIRYALDGALWVERARPQGASREADVYDASGKWIAIAEWPRIYNLVSEFTVLNGRVAIATAKDENDLERIVRLRFR